MEELAGGEVPQVEKVVAEGVSKKGGGRKDGSQKGGRKVAAVEIVGKRNPEGLGVFLGVLRKEMEEFFREF